MARKKRLESSGRDDFVEAVLQMLDEGVPLCDLNLRQVARRVGCAHTNAYNYFSSFSEIQWWALKEALESLINRAAADDQDLLEVYIDFAVEHPAWFRLIWLDPLGGTPPLEVQAFLEKPGVIFINWLSGKLRMDPEVDLVVNGSRILHAYVHGELSAFTAGRLEESREAFRKQILRNTDKLYRMLFGEVRVTEKQS